MAQLWRNSWKAQPCDYLTQVLQWQSETAIRFPSETFEAWGVYSRLHTIEPSTVMKTDWVVGHLYITPTWKAISLNKISRKEENNQSRRENTILLCNAWAEKEMDSGHYLIILLWTISFTTFHSFEEMVSTISQEICIFFQRAIGRRHLLRTESTPKKTLWKHLVSVWISISYIFWEKY